MKIKTSIIVGAILLLVGLVFNYKPTNTQSNIKMIENQSSQERIIVYISGEVKRPGLYEINKGARLNDLIKQAGGFTSLADYKKINLASALVDGDFILIQAEEKEDEDNTKGLISINKATKEELMKLEGIGEVKANNIINYRSKNGPFFRLEDLLKVSGISSAIYDKIKNSITL